MRFDRGLANGRYREGVSDAGPSSTYPPSVRAGVRKPPRKEPAGRWRAVCRLWGFDRAAALARAALGGVVAVGLPFITENCPPPLQATV